MDGPGRDTSLSESARQWSAQSGRSAEATRLHRELETRHDRLRRDVDHAIQQIDRGQGIELNDEDKLRQFFDDIKARGRQRLERRKNRAIEANARALELESASWRVL